MGRSVSKRPKRKHSEGKEPYEMLNGAKPLSNNNSWAQEGQRKSPKMNWSNWKGALQKPLSEELSYKMLKKKNNKSTKKKSSDRRRLS